jgi:hypothetical protein
LNASTAGYGKSQIYHFLVEHCNCFYPFENCNIVPILKNYKTWESSNVDKSSLVPNY